MRVSSLIASVVAVAVVNVAAAAVAAWQPLVHGMPVDLGPLHPSLQGVVGYVCETQPREYTDSRGRIHVEVDRYVQLEECPKEKIR